MLGNAESHKLTNTLGQDFWEPLLLKWLFNHLLLDSLLSKLVLSSGESWVGPRSCREQVGAHLLLLFPPSSQCLSLQPVAVPCCCPQLQGWMVHFLSGSHYCQVSSFLTTFLSCDDLGSQEKRRAHWDPGATDSSSPACPWPVTLHSKNISSWEPGHRAAWHPGAKLLNLPHCPFQANSVISAPRDILDFALGSTG
jgi:hypothetical protein